MTSANPLRVCLDNLHRVPPALRKSFCGRWCNVVETFCGTFRSAFCGPRVVSVGGSPPNSHSPHHSRFEATLRNTPFFQGVLRSRLPKMVLRRISLVGKAAKAQTGPLDGSRQQKWRLAGSVVGRRDGAGRTRSHWASERTRGEGLSIGHVM